MDENNPNMNQQVPQQPVQQNNKKMKTCKACGAPIAKKAKKCPQCGAKNKSHKLLGIILVIIGVIIVIGALGSSGDSDTSTPSSGSDNTTVSEAPKSYVKVEATDLFDVLKGNAAKAQKEYEGTYVEVSGYITNIDASGDYVCIGAPQDNYDYYLDSVQCYIQNDEQLNKVLDMSTGDYITIKGKIISVGEVMGYSLNIDSIS